MPEIDKVDIVTDGHGVLFENRNPNKLPSSVKFPLDTENLITSRSFLLLPRALKYRLVTPVGLSAEYRMTNEELLRVTDTDNAMTPEQILQQINNYKQDFVDQYTPNQRQLEALRGLNTELGKKIIMATGTPGVLHNVVSKWLDELGVSPYLYEAFLNRDRLNGPTVGKLGILRMVNPQYFVEDSLYTCLCAAVETNVEIHNPLTREEAIRREKVVRVPHDIPEQIREETVAVLNGEHPTKNIIFESGLTEIYAEELVKKTQIPAIGNLILEVWSEEYAKKRVDQEVTIPVAAI